MQKIDAHQHFWKYNPVRDSWITDDMAILRKDFLPADIKPLFAENNIDGCIAIQADQSEEENYFLLQQAKENDFIKGVVGWIDLRSPAIEERLKYFKPFKKLKGFRHILQGEPDRDMMLHKNFKRGIGLLRKYGFTYDLLIYPDQLLFAKELVEQFPDQKFVIDHIAKPCIKFKKLKGWEGPIKMIGGYENVYCKMSGLVTEAEWQHWDKETLKPYMDVVVESFGTGRIMFGSDWPVCLVAARYGEVLNLMQDYFSSFSKTEQENIFGGNAIEFYNL
jgi:L-fuconolactonase